MSTKKKYYAVKAGRQTGIFNTWDECKKNVIGYPGASYKSFELLKDAKKFLTATENQYDVEIDSSIDMIAYIDGSYDNAIKRYSFGAIVFYKGEKYTFSKSENDSELVGLRNVAGELKAAMLVMDFAVEKEVNRIVIYYDYSGIEKWANGEWQAKIDFTQKYVKHVSKIRESLNISFNKVKAHTGNKYNEEVDQLAKNALHVESDHIKRP